MLDWIADKILALVSWIPALLVEESSPSFIAIRAMFALILIVLFIYVVGLGVSRDAISRHMEKMVSLFSRKR